MDEGQINNDLCKTDAIILAHNMSHKSGSPVYAVETRYGWTCASRKPSLRFGKVIECYEGKEFYA
jgi:hypothetical protein